MLNTLQKQSKRILEQTPAVDTQLVFCIQFHNFFPTGVFERVICIFVSRSAQMEGSRKPQIASKVANVYFCIVPAFMLSEVTEKRVKVILQALAQSHLPELLAFVQEVLVIMTRDVFGEKLQSSVLLESADDRKMLVKLEDVQKAVRARKDVVKFCSAVPVKITRLVVCTPFNATIV